MTINLYFYQFPFVFKSFHPDLPLLPAQSNIKMVWPRHHYHPHSGTIVYKVQSCLAANIYVNLDS